MTVFRLPHLRAARLPVATPAPDQRLDIQRAALVAMTLAYIDAGLTRRDDGPLRPEYALANWLVDAGLMTVTTLHHDRSDGVAVTLFGITGDDAPSLQAALRTWQTAARDRLALGVAR